MAILSRSEANSIQDSLIQDRDKHMPKWEEQGRYIAPNRLKRDNRKTDGRKKTQDIINNQAGRSMRTFQSGMMNGATPSSRPWFNVVSSDPMVSQAASVKKYYKKVESTVESHLQLSNFYRVMPLTYKDLAVFSNSAMAMLEDAVTGFHFYHFAVGTYAFACDEKSRPNMFVREFTLNVRQVIEKYAGRDEKGDIDYKNIDAGIIEKYKAKQYLDDVMLCNLIVPNPDYNPSKQSLNSHDKKFQSYTYVTGTNSNGVPSQSPVGFRNTNGEDKATKDKGNLKEYIKVSGFDYFPVIISRWEVEPEGYYGIDGPGETAIADIKTLQKIEEYKFEAVVKLVRPPMVGHASLRRHQSSILAGGITYVDDRGMQHGFKPAFSINPQLSELLGSKDEIERYIGNSFYEDLFRQLSSEKKLSHVTAAEINQRASETVAAIAPILGQFDHDTTGPIIENAIYLLDKAGKLPEKPKELEDKSLKPEYISVLAQASKASLITTQEKFIGYVSSVSQALQRPELLRIVNAEKDVRQYAENAGIDPETILDEAEYNKSVEEYQEAMAKRAQQELAMQEAATAKTLSETKTTGDNALAAQ